MKLKTLNGIPTAPTKAVEDQMEQPESEDDEIELEEEILARQVANNIMATKKQVTVTVPAQQQPPKITPQIATTANKSPENTTETPAQPPQTTTKTSGKW
jgi:hypothetical protein